MKKVFGLIVCFLVLSATFAVFAVADYDNEAIKNRIKDEIRNEVDNVKIEARKAIAEVKTEELKKRVEDFRERIKKHDGRFNLDGRDINIKEMSDERKEIIAGKINAKTGLNLTAEDIEDGKVGQILRAYLSNGAYARIKIMPDRAAAKAVERLKAKCIERNCTVELKEFKVGNKSIAGYEVETEKDSKLLLIFSKKIKVRAVVDAETGDIIYLKKPWWAFLAKEKDEEETEIEDEKKVTVCHIPGGNESASNSIKIGESALDAHLAHGDYEGECKVDVVVNQTENNTGYSYYPPKPHPINPNLSNN